MLSEVCKIKNDPLEDHSLRKKVKGTLYLTEQYSKVSKEKK